MSAIITLMNLIDTHRIDESWVQSFKLVGFLKKNIDLLLTNRFVNIRCLRSQIFFFAAIFIIRGFITGSIFMIDPFVTSNRLLPPPPSYVYLGWPIDRDQPVPIAALRSDRVKLLIK